MNNDRLNDIVSVKCLLCLSLKRLADTGEQNADER